MKYLLATAVLMVTVGCSVDDTKNPGPRCNADGTCPMGLLCYRGFCIAGGGVECDEEGMVIDCYTGETGCDGACVGACQPGTRECRLGVFTACLGQVVPGLETCNGEDDDCDGLTDEIADPACDSGARGACAAGTLTCQGMSAVCGSVVDPAPEVCDGDDEDCDDQVDERTDVSCYPAMPGCNDLGDGTFDCTGVCTPGTQACMGGSLGPCMGAVTPGSMDDCTPMGMTALDDDCDGMSDEDCACAPAGSTQACYGGPMGTEGVGECRMGTQTCESIGMGMNRFGACTGEVVPQPESCANDSMTDDDCNGTADDIPGRGDPCTDMMAMGECRNGFQGCMGATLGCLTPAPTTELCDSLDNDCDGAVDNGFDLLTDDNNCGSCGTVCGGGTTCCAGTCVDVASDAAHCGTCGNACGMGVTCCSGACADTQIDEMNCGGCGTACGMGQQCCDSACVDTRQDEMHCGTCGTTCTAAQQCCLGGCVDPMDPSCGVCLADCTSMGLTCCSGSCLDTSNDPLNCGGCEVACGAGQLCCSGSCVNSNSANCGTCGTTCSAAQLCCVGACVPDDSANCGMCGTTCSGGQDCCDSSCTDVSSDDANCGSCGTACSGGESCSNGRCCGMGLTGCGGSCVDLTTDRRNCGQCSFNCRGFETCMMGCCVHDSTGAMRCP